MPNRLIKDTICTSESLSQLKDFHENFFYRLIVNCDDYGRMDARPAILKAKLYPLRERLTLRDVEDALQALAAVGCVERYEVDGKPYLQLPTWGVHQQIRAKKSKFPAPDIICNQMISDDIKCTRNPIQSNPNNIPDCESGEPVSIDKAFEKTYAIYPVKKGKAKGRQSYINLLKGRKEIGGKKYRLNHQQIYFAVRQYAEEQVNTDPQYIKHFDTFLNGPVLDYFEAAKADYDGWLAEEFAGEEPSYVYV